MSNIRNNSIMGINYKAIKKHDSDERKKGLYNKYIVRRADKKPNDKEEYFVLRLDSHGSDKIHREACRKAVLLYAEEIKNHLPNLSKDLIKRYGKEAS